MGINQVEVDMYWNYFLSIEEDFLRVSKYVHFNTANNGCYSIEFARLILAACSEVDVVAKALTTLLTGASTESITQHMNALMPKLPDIPDRKVSMDRFGMDVMPWDNWQKNKSPDWWGSYNNIKHHRAEHFQEANLENAFRAVAGLFLLLIYYLRHTGVEHIYPVPRLLSTEDDLASFATDPRKRILVIIP
jgi:hypothetical protein